MTIETLVKTLEYDINIAKLGSLNDMYKIGSSGRRKWIYLNPEIEAIKVEICKQLKLQGIVSDFSDIEKSDVGLRLNLTYVLNDNIWKRDVDNMLKYTVDAFSSVCGVDDKFVLNIHTNKIQNLPDDAFEHILITCEIHNNRNHIINLIPESTLLRISKICRKLIKAKN